MHDDAPLADEAPLDEAPLPEPEPLGDEPPAGADLDAFAVLLDLLRRTHALTELQLRTPVVGETLARLPAPAAAFVLDQLVRRTITGDGRAASALLGAAAWMLRDASTYGWRSAVYEAAAEESMECAPKFLLELPAHKVLQNKRALRQPRFERDVSLGERKQLARGNNRLLLEQLLLDLDPSVMEKLCQNPHVTKQDLLGVLTRRPNVPEILHQVARSWRWIADYDVRHALVSNPYLDGGTALRLLPFLHGADIRRIARSAELHPVLTQHAARLLVIRSARSLSP